jgi:serine protease inhibitor
MVITSDETTVAWKMEEWRWRTDMKLSRVFLGLAVGALSSGGNSLSLPSAAETLAVSPKSSQTTHINRSTKQAIGVADVKASTTLIERSNDFGFKLFKENLKAKQTANVVISPISLTIALQMAASAATGQTQTEMLNALSLSGIELDVINAFNKQYMLKVALIKPPETLEIANGLFVHKNFDLSPSFAAKLKDNFNATTQAVDFATGESVKLINGWVARNTHEKIEGILSEPMPDLRLLIANAVYFKGKWFNQFKLANTKPQVFHGIGSEAKVPMMNQGGSYLYSENDDIQCISLPYASAADKEKREGVYDAGPNHSRMVIILPRQGRMLAVEEKLSSAWFQGVVASLHQAKGWIALPRFKSEYKALENDALKALGMKCAFTEHSKITKASASGEPLMISIVLHKTFMEVNEEGTEAAAVTAVMMVPACVVVEPPPFKMVVDRPFFLAIQDDSGRILFLGRIGEIKGS